MNKGGHMNNHKSIALVFTVFLIICTCLRAEALNDYTGWSNRVKININNPTTTSATNYPVMISVPAKTYIDAGKMNSDMGDIRFADSAGYPLPFWISITENMVRNFNNIPVYVRLKTFSAGDNTIYMYFDKTKLKTDKSPQPNYTTSNSTYCGDGGTTSSVPYSHEACGNNTFASLFAFDCTTTDWNADSGCKGNTNKKWVSKLKAGSTNNSLVLHFRTHFETNYGNMYAYFLTQHTAVPAQGSLDKYCGYRLRYEYGSTSNANDTVNMDTNKMHIEKKTNNCGNNNTGWSDVTGSPFTNWKPYGNSIQDIEIKATSSIIKLLVNDNHIGKVDRSDTWTDGYIGFDRGGWTQSAEVGSNSTDGISPIWVVNTYLDEPVVTFVGNTDIKIKRILPTIDASTIGTDVIEYTPLTQILDDTIDGDTLDKYVYNGYPLASPTRQTFKNAVTITNRGTSEDTFSIDLSKRGVPSQWSISFAQDTEGYTPNLPGTGGTATAGSVTLAAGASTVINIIAIPTASALFEGGMGRLVLDFKVLSKTDFSFDYARFNLKINGKSGCYWKWKMPITASYNDTNSTGNLVNHQVQVNLTGIDFSEARSDGNDIIFTDDSGTAIPFWKKSFNKTAGTASYWVKPNSLKSGTPGKTTLYMWWGNESYSVSRSNKTETFDMWEDWERSTVGAKLGCPDGTSQCSGVTADPNDLYEWRNYPQTSNNFDWWSIQNRLDGKAARAYLSSVSSTSDFGPILAGGDIRWKSYEVSYSFYNDIDNTKAIYNPVFFQDAGNGWGLEFYANKFIFRPFGAGTDWTWARQINASAKLGGSTFPAINKRYWVKVRLFQNPSDSKTHLKLFISPTNSGTTAPADTDSDTSFVEVTPATTGIIPDNAFSLQSGMVGFGGWDGGLATDNVRVRKYTEPEPSCTGGTVGLTNYDPIKTLSMPVLTAPLLNGRPILLSALLTTFKWTGNLNAIFADCYIAGDCQTGEDQTKQGTISLWGKVDDTTPKGFGEQLQLAVAGDNNRTTVDDNNWQTNGRYIFTSYDSDSDGKISCTKTSADCIALGTDNASLLKSYLGFATEASPYPQTVDLIKFARGQYVSNFSRSDVRNNCSSGTADTCQWKLGDVIHSNPLVVGVPNMLYADPAYDTFKTNNSNRDMVTYIGSNDGMVHAVRMAKWDATNKKYVADTTATELWAYVPNALLSGLTNTTDNYHEYTNDGLLRAIDIKTTGSTPVYKTFLIGGLRTGGQGLYALDVTNPKAANLVWEINTKTNATEFARMGKTWSAPALGRLCETAPCSSSNTSNRWVGITGSGFAPDDIKNLSNNAYISFVNLETGAIIKQIKVSAKVANITTNIGVLRDKNGYIQKVYFGDYYGAVWRVDLTTTAKVAALLDVSKTVLTDTDMLFKPSDYATSDSTVAGKQPIRPVTSQPAFAYSKDSSGNDVWWVYFGTGAYDLYDAAYPYQRFYGLKDTLTTPYLDTGLTDMTTTATATNTTKGSWLMELGHSDSLDYEYNATSTAACVTTCINQSYSADYCATRCKNVSTSTKNRNERVIATPTIYGGFTFISTYTPSNTACGGGVARFYGVKYDTGSYEGSLMQFGNKSDARSIAISTSGGVPSTPLVYSGKSGSGQVVAAGLVDTSTGGLSKTPLNPDKFSLNINLLLWRKIR